MSVFIRLNLLVILLWAIAPLAAGVDLSANPHALVEQVSDEIFAELDSRRDFYESDQSQLENLVRDKFLPVIDSYYAARLILGRQVRGLEKQQVNDFSDALSDLLVRRYAEGLLDFKSRDQMEIMALTGRNSEKMTRVRTQVMLTSGQVAPVDYVFRKTKQGNWKAFDVVIEGISYVTTYRNQFGEEIRRDGFDAVLSRIRNGEVQTDFSNDAS